MSGGPSLVQRGRYGGSTNTTGLSSNGSTGNQVMGFVNGVPCVRMTNGINLAGGPVATLDGMGRFHPALLKTAAKWAQSVDDYQAIRVYALMRVTGSPVNATDCGLELVLGPNASTGVFVGAVPGFCLNFDTTGTMSYVQHGNSGAVTSTRISPTVAAGYLNTDWHMAEFRILSATATVDAQLKILFDNQTVLTKSWGNPADDMPTPNSPGGNNNNGWCLNVQYQAQNGEMDVGLVRAQMAPNENALF